MKRVVASLSPTPAILFLLAFALILFLSACDTQTETEGRVQVLLTDAPLDDILEANITITRVELMDSTGQVTVLNEDPQPFNLLELRNGVTAPLADLPVLSNTYSQLRVIVEDDAHVLLADSSTETLKIPSGTSSGIKLMKLPAFEIDSGDDVVVITIDFDVEKSFVKAGNSGKYIFKPVIKPLFIEFNGDSLGIPVDTTAAG